VRIHPIVGTAAACLIPLACVTGGSAWIGDLGAPPEPRRALSYDAEVRPARGESSSPTALAGEETPPDWIVDPGDPPGEVAANDGAPVLLRDHGRARAAPPGLAPTLAQDVYRNTYYDFPSEGPGVKDATVYDATCSSIARVTTEFHDRVCVQGSGRLTDGATVSFARRGCACAAVCPRTNQQICFERLDPARFPSGRGAMGRAITPLRTVAVDSSVIPLGTPLYIPEYAGVARPDGSAHDGCFLAEDRGVRVVGQHIDVFTGDPAVTARWNALVPSNRGVHVFPNHPSCRPAVPAR